MVERFCPPTMSHLKAAQMATILPPDDLPNRRTDGRACDESYAGVSQDLQGMSVSFGRPDGRRLRPLCSR